MSEVSSYYVALHTKEVVPPAEYATRANLLLELFRTVLTDPTHVSAITHAAKLSNAAVEVEISHNESLSAAAVIELSADSRVPCDKSKLTQLLKSLGPWPHAKIEKRAVPQP